MKEITLQSIGTLKHVSADLSVKAPLKFRKIAYKEKTQK